MIIRCLSNQTSALRSFPPGVEKYLPRDGKFSITPDKDYVVFALTVTLCQPWYYICDDDYDDELIQYPVWQPAQLFRVVDPRISKHWEWNYFPPDRPSETDYPIAAFPDWARDVYYYDRLTDHDPEAVATFRRYKLLMEAETQQRRNPQA